MRTPWRVILWVFLLFLVDDSCCRVSSCIAAWLVSVLSSYLWFIRGVFSRCPIKLLISCMLSCSPCETLGRIVIVHPLPCFHSS
jgi:hypothetical protein